MKKDGIQTRNRKLSAKCKKKRGGMADFFRGTGFDSRWAGMGMGMAGMGGMTPALASPMSGYYTGGMSGMSGMSSQFMASPGAMSSMYMGGMSSNLASPHSLAAAPHSAFSLGNTAVGAGNAAGPNSMVGATA